MLDEFESGGIQPLQIIEEQREGMLRPGEHVQKTLEHQLKSILRFPWRQVWSRRLFADDELQLRNKVDDELSIRPERLFQVAPPGLHFRFAPDENLTDQRLEGLREGGVRNVALVLVELARR